MIVNDIHVVSRFFTDRQCGALYRKLILLPAESPNSMNKYGRPLDTPEWQRWVDDLVAKRIALIAKNHYGVTLAKRGHYAFAVEYSSKNQRGLSEHFDSSDVTLNVCVAGRFSGGRLVFTTPGIYVDQKIGRGFIHRGSETHRAEPITTGTRMNLVVWCRKRS